MSWVRIEDLFPDHPKIVDLSDRAFRMHIKGICYSVRALTDGHIPAKIAHSFAPNAKRFCDELVQKGVWARIGNGYEIHDFTEYQPSRDEVLEHRKKGAVRQAKWRDRHAPRNGVTPSTSNAVTNAAPFHTTPIPPNPRTAGEQDLEQIDPNTIVGTPRATGTNPRARRQSAKAQRSHDRFVERTIGLYHQWLSEPDRTPEGVAHEIRQAYPDIAEEVLAKVNT